MSSSTEILPNIFSLKKKSSIFENEHPNTKVNIFKIF